MRQTVMQQILVGQTMIRQAITRNAIILALFAVATAAVLAFTNSRTVGMIECNRQQALRDSLHAVMPKKLADNNLLTDYVNATDEKMLGPGTHRIYRARLNGKPSGAVLEATAPDGYGGPINLLVGVRADGTIAGVRVVPPLHETPGLGDNVEMDKSHWVLGFNGHSLGNTTEKQWAVKKDGGEFDQFTGATITPRAVVGAVHRALQYFKAHRATLFTEPAAHAAGGEDCNG